MKSLSALITQERVVWTLVLAAALSRLVPHVPNFTAVGATAIYAGAMMPNFRKALLVPFLAMVLTDIVLGFHSTMLWQYCAFMAVVAISRVMLTPWSLGRGLLTGVVGSGLFFAVSNFAVWFQGGLYPLTLNGLVACYLNALPFLSNQVAGDAFYMIMIFGTHFLVLRNAAAVQLVSSTGK